MKTLHGKTGETPAPGLTRFGAAQVVCAAAVSHTARNVWGNARLLYSASRLKNLEVGIDDEKLGHETRA